MSPSDCADYPPERINFSFAPDGAAATCLTSFDPLLTGIELYSFAGPAAPSVRIPLDLADGSPNFVTPTPDGHVLLARGIGEGRVEFVVLATDGSVVRSLGAIPCDKLCLWPSPDEETLAVVTCRTGDGDGAVWRVGTDGVRRLVELPGLRLVGGGWLDADGVRFGVNRSGEDGRIVPVAVTMSGHSEPVLPGDTGANRVLQLGLAGRVLVASDEDGPFRFGFGSDGEPGLTFPPGLNTIDGTVRPVSADASGSRVVLHVSRGVRSHIVCYDVADDSHVEFDLPLGTLAGPAKFGTDEHGEVLRLPFSTPAQPTEILTVGLRGDRPATFVPPADPAPMRVRTQSFSGPGGEFEALVYGDPDWRHARQVVIALHGGPEDAWRPRFDPLFRRLEAAGLTVIAPNTRGSTHYGVAHQDAIRGVWGGPDLADVRHLADTIAREGDDPELLLYGLSYGAYLALLAAGADPRRWSRCVAVAPFLSGAHLYPEASTSVRRLLDRLDGRPTFADDLGPRDVLNFAPRITAELLLVHGDEDTTIPVGQSRTLRDHLYDAGWREGAGFRYLELAGEGHYPRFGPDGDSIQESISAFLLRGELPPPPPPERSPSDSDHRDRKEVKLNGG